MSAKKSATAPEGMCFDCHTAPAQPGTGFCIPCDLDAKVKNYGVTRVLAMYPPLRSDDGFSCIRCRNPIHPIRVEHGDNKTCIGCREALEKIELTARRPATKCVLAVVPRGPGDDRVRTRNRRLIRAEGALY